MVKEIGAFKEEKKNENEVKKEKKLAAAWYSVQAALARKQAK